jgi:acyl-CoA thioester hydrolase
MTKTPHSNYKIRFSDCDLFGHLNNARYLDYMINAREDHLKQAHQFDISKYYKNDLAWVITNHEISYLRPAFYEEIVRIQSSLLKMEKDSLLVEILMFNEAGTQLKAILRSTMAHINYKTGRRAEHELEFVDWARGLILGDAVAALSLNERIAHLQAELKQSNAKSSS